jgi:predicted small metal-binding protein
MKEWRCSNIVPECSWSYGAESEDEILASAAQHARDAHGMEEVPPEIVDRIRATIVEVS